MKKLLLPVLFFSTVTANAQFKEGDKYLGGSVNLGVYSASSSYNNPVYTSSGNNFGININTQRLKATNVNTLQGFTLGTGYSTGNFKQNDLPGTDIKIVSNALNASIGYMVRKYRPIVERLFWYMQYDASVGYSYIWQKDVNSTGSANSHSSLFNIGATALPALAIKASDRLLVDVNFGGLSTNYYHNNYQNGHGDSFSLQLGFSSHITLGMLLKINKHKG